MSYSGAMGPQLPSTRFVSLSRAYEYVGLLRYGNDWPGLNAKREWGPLAPHRVVLESLCDDLKLGNLAFNAIDQQALDSNEIVWIRLQDEAVVTYDDRLVPIEIQTLSLIGAMRERGLIDSSTKLGRPVQIGWAQFVHEAWEYALSVDGKFSDEEMYAYLTNWADTNETTRPTRTTLNGWCTRIRGAFSKR
jgi:hypothetical protein